MLVLKLIVRRCEDKICIHTDVSGRLLEEHVFVTIRDVNVKFTSASRSVILERAYPIVGYQCKKRSERELEMARASRARGHKNSRSSDKIRDRIIKVRRAAGDCLHYAPRFSCLLLVYHCILQVPTHSTPLPHPISCNVSIGDALEASERR